MLKIKTFAKTNLCLNVEKEKKQGLHKIDSVMVSIDISDEIILSKRTDQIIEVTSNIKIDGENTAFKAADLIIRRYNLSGVNIHIDKSIPLCGGLGGSSADAVAVIHGMFLLFDLKGESEKRYIAKQIGSDVTAMLTGGFKHVTSFGEVVKEIKSKVKLFGVVAKTPGGTNCKDVYNKFDELVERAKDCEKIKQNDVNALIDGLQKNSSEKVFENIGNMLSRPAMEVDKGIKLTFDSLKNSGALAVNISGSGSCVVAFFEDKAKAREAKENLKGEFEFLEEFEVVDYPVEMSISTY